MDYLATVPSDISPEENSWTQKELKLLGFDIGCEIPAMTNFKPEFTMVMLLFAVQYCLPCLTHLPVEFIALAPWICWITKTSFMHWTDGVGIPASYLPRIATLGARGFVTQVLIGNLKSQVLQCKNEVFDASANANMQRLLRNGN